MYLERQTTFGIKLLRVILPIVPYFFYWSVLMPLTGPLPGWCVYLLFGGMAYILCDIFRLKVEPKQEKGALLHQVLFGLQLGLVVAVVMVMIFLLLYGHPSRFLTAGEERLAGVLSNMLYYLFLVAPVEELLFRGYLQTCWRDLTGSASAGVLIQAVLFGLWHWPGAHSVVQVLSTAVLGLVYGGVLQYGKHGGLAAVIAAHGAHNLVLELIRYLWC